MTFYQAIADLKQRPVTEFYQLEKSRGANMYCCPICGSGHGAHKTGALKVDTTTNRVTCFSGGCFGDKGEDTPGALKRIWEHDEGKIISFRELLIRAGYNIDDDRSAPPPKKEKRDPTPAAALEDHTDEYRAWNDFLLQDEPALATVHSWGITDEAIKHFLIGYSPEWAHHTNPRKKSQRVIIPRDGYSYSARTIDRSYTGEGKYLIEGQQKAIFNAIAMHDIENKNPIVVVEGEIDAIVIWQLGITEVVALGSATGKNHFIEQVKKINPAAVYVLALDNDEAGKTAQQYIADEFSEAGIAYLSADTATLYDGMKDAGEAVPKDDEAFIRRLYPYLEKGYEMREERDKAAEIEAYNSSGAGMVDLFLQGIQSRRYQPISSGISSLDRAIGGGFIRESVVMLGAAPGMGKTALVSQICENIAARGDEDILYINLEMSREVLLARSIARIANASGSGITVNEILRGYSWDTGTREIIGMAADEYKNTIASHLVYNPGKPETDLDKIIGKIEAERRRIGHAPIVCLDYLQLLTGRTDEDNIDIIKRAMQTFKAYANDNHTVVFIITANNRDSMRTGESGLNSGRDSSNIEYGADLHMGLEYACVGNTVKGFTRGENGEPEIKIEKGKDLSFIGTVKTAYRQMLQDNKGIQDKDWNSDAKSLKEAYERYCTTYVIRVNKNRYGDGEEKATLVFDGAKARFIEIDTIHKAPRQKSRIV